MTRTTKRILADARKLSVVERFELVRALERMLGPEPQPGVSQADIDSAWKAEIRRRLAAFDEGRVEAIPWDVVRRELFRTRDAARGHDPRHRTPRSRRGAGLVPKRQRRPR